MKGALVQIRDKEGNTPFDLALKLKGSENDNLSKKITSILKGQKKGGNLLTGCSPTHQKERSIKQVLVLFCFLVVINVIKVYAIYIFLHMALVIINITVDSVTVLTFIIVN